MNFTFPFFSARKKTSPQPTENPPVRTTDRTNHIDVCALSEDRALVTFADETSNTLQVRSWGVGRTGVSCTCRSFMFFWVNQLESYGTWLGKPIALSTCAAKRIGMMTPPQGLTHLFFGRCIGDITIATFHKLVGAPVVPSLKLQMIFWGAPPFFQGFRLLPGSVFWCFLLSEEVVNGWSTNSPHVPKQKQGFNKALL